MSRSNTETSASAGPDTAPVPKSGTHRFALLALTAGGFGIGLTEFVIAGLLPEVAKAFSVTEARAGALISGYALSVAVGAVVITAAATRLDRKHTLLGLVVLFIVGNLTSALAPGYGVMMAGRIIAALCHGAFFGIGAVVAAGLVAPERRAAAIATMFAGLTAANVLGVPLGTFIGQQFGWRATFWVITAVGVVALVGIATAIPRTPVDSDARLLRELAAFRSPQVWLSLVITACGFGGMFGAFTYIAYTLTGVTGFPDSAVPWLLVLFGAGLVVGNQLGGRFADRSVTGTLGVVLLALTLVMAAFALTAENQIPATVFLFLMGAFGFATVPGLQMRIMSHAPTAPTLASGANIAAFNLGNAIGAWVGGLTIAAGMGYTSPLWVGAGLTLAGLAVLGLSSAAERP